MPTHFLGPQSAPTVVTCLPKNAVLIWFTYNNNNNNNNNNCLFSKRLATNRTDIGNGLVVTIIRLEGMKK